MKEITAGLYKFKFFLKILLRSIGFSFLTMLVMSFLGFLPTFLELVIKVFATVYGIKFIYLDGLKKLNNKYTLNEMEYQKLEQTIGGMLIIMGIIGFIFSLIGNSLFLLLEIFAGLFVGSLVGGGYGATSFITAKTIIMLIISVLSNIVYSVLVVITVKRNFRNIYENQKLAYTNAMLILAIVFIVSSLISSFMLTNSTSEMEDATSQLNNSDFTITDDSLLPEEDEETETPVEEDNTSMLNQEVDITISLSDSYTVFNENEIYVGNLQGKGLFKATSTLMDKFVLVANDTDKIQYKNAHVLYKNDTNLYFYYPKNEIFLNSNTTEEDHGLYCLTLADGTATKVLDKVDFYKFNGDKLTNTFDYKVTTDGTSYIKSYDFETQTESTIMSYTPIEGTSEVLQKYKGNFFITLIDPLQNKTQIYKNDQLFCNIDMAVNKSIVSNNELHFFVANAVYSLDVNTGNINFSGSTPFETQNLKLQNYIIDEELDIFPMLDTQLQYYIYNPLNRQFEAREKFTQTAFPSDEFTIYNLDINNLLLITNKGSVSIADKNTLNVIKTHASSELDSINLDTNGNCFVRTSSASKKFQKLTAFGID